MKKSRAFFGAGIFALLVGCGAGKGTDFVGHWTEVNGKTDKLMILDISYDGEVFHVDEEVNYLGKDYKNKLVGKPESETTLSFKGVLGDAIYMRLQGDRIFYQGRELSKLP